MSDNPITIREISSKQDITRFLDLPLKLYANDPAFVPQLYLERREHLDPKKNPYFQHAKVQLFLAKRNGEVIGRISAQIDQLHLDNYGDATGQFGFLEAIDDAETFKSLLDAAANWLKQRGIKRMQGPFNFSINEEMGMLIDGFESRPKIMMPHSLPYYQKHMEVLGFAKAMDVYAYEFDRLPELPRSMRAMLNKVKKSGDLEVRAFSKKNLERDLSIVIDIFNDAWSDNWNFVPMTDAEIKALGDNLKMLVKDDYIAIASWQGKPAAMAVSLPDMNDWIHDLKGRLLPFGWAKLLWRMKSKPPASIRIPLMGVMKQHHATPVGSALALAVIDFVREAHENYGTSKAEVSWILEINEPMRKMIEVLGGKIYKTYRIFERDV